LDKPRHPVHRVLAAYLVISPAPPLEPGQTRHHDGYRGAWRQESAEGGQIPLA